MVTILLTPAQVGEALGIGRTKVYQLLATGELPTIRVGSRIRIPEAALVQWVVNRTQKASRDVE